jgi:hypothetical protein
MMNTTSPDVLSAAIVAGLDDAVERWVLATVAEVTARRTPFAAVHHPLGFLCLPVVRLPDIGVCVHLWSHRRYPASVSTSPIHCHSWDLVSYVLYGAVRNDVLDVVPVAAAEEGTHRVFEVHSGDDGDEVRATECVVRCTGTTIRYARAGEAYTLTSGEFHTTTGSDDADDAATVVIGRTRPGAIDRSLGALHTPTHRVRRAHADPATTRAALRAVTRRLKRSA